MKLVLSALAAAITAMPAMADGLYINGGANIVEIDGEVLSNPDGQYQATMLFANAGLDFTDHLGAEFDIQAGISDAEETDDFYMTDDRIRINSLAGFYAKLGVPLADILWVGGRVGAVGGDVRVSIRDQLTGDTFRRSGEVAGLGYGGVATLDFADGIFMRFDYTRYALEDFDGVPFDADGYSLSLGMRF